MTEKPLQATFEVDKVETRIVTADNKKNYERDTLTEHLFSKAAVIRPSQDAAYEKCHISVTNELLGTYLRVSELYKGEYNKGEILANVFKLQFSIWSKNHHAELLECKNIHDRLYRGTLEEYIIYKESLKKDRRDYVKGERPRINVFIHKKESYPLCCAYASIAGISVPEFIDGILSGGFCLWKDIPENARNDLFPIFRELETKFNKRVVMFRGCSV